MALGLVMILFGGLIIASPTHLFTASLTAEIIIGLGFVISGGLQFVHGVKERFTRSGLWHIFGGLIYGAGGLFLLSHPASGLVSIVILVAVILIADGVATALFGISLKGHKRQIWILASAAVSVLVGLILFAELPTSASWMLGLFVGVAFLTEGVSFFLLGLDAHAFSSETTGNE